MEREEGVDIGPGDRLEAHPALPALVDVHEPGPYVLGFHGHRGAVCEVVLDPGFCQELHNLSRCAAFRIGLSEPEGVARGFIRVGLYA